MTSRAIFFVISTVLLGTVITLYKTQYSYFIKKDSVDMSECSMPERLGQIPVPYDNVENWQIPTIVPLDDVQRSYVSEVLLALVRVIGEVSSLESQERTILGCGQFYWPKNPAEPTQVSKSYFGENFRMAGIAARLERKSAGSPWIKAGLTVRPRNFPRGVYDMDLSSEIFRDFILQKVAKEERQNERVKLPVVFYFEHKKIKHLILRVAARDDVAQVADPFPSSFHMVEIMRDDIPSAIK